MARLLKDSLWVRQSFLVKAEDLDLVDRQNRIFTSASLKFTDTTPGGNFAINPFPQFTRYCDPRAQGRYFAGENRTASKGMGRYYSEAIDDNKQMIHLRFGVPQFNSLTTFFTGFYNGEAGQLARTGRARNVLYYTGRAAGFVVSVMSWKLIAIQTIGVMSRFAFDKPASKFYYLKPTMPMYWNAVTTMVNHIAVNRGIVPRVGGADATKLNGGYEFSDDALGELHKLLPDIFRPKGGIDVYALATRGQRLARKQQRIDENLNDAGYMSNKDLARRIHENYSSAASLRDDKRPNFDNYMERWFSNDNSQPLPAGSMGSDAISDEPEKRKNVAQRFGEFFAAELDDGSAFATFRVNSTGPVNESFSSTVTESEISSKINGMASQSRSSSFNFANGNIVGGAVGSLIGGVMQGVKDFTGGMLDQLQISGLAALGGAAFVDIPKHWQSSQATLPRSTYTIQLVSPYGNAISQLLNIHVPLCMLLAGALPLSTGKQSYTSPFICEVYDQGRCQSRLAIIDSLTVTRGIGNLGFNNEGHAMGVEVTFTVMDLSSVLHMPIAEGFSLGTAVASVAAGAVGVAAAGGGAALGAAAGPVTSAVAGSAAGIAAAGALMGLWDEDTVFSDYMATLSGMSLQDQIYPMRKIKLNLTRRLAGWDSFWSASRIAMFSGDVLPARMVSALYRGTER